MGLPLNHQFIAGNFHEINHLFWDSPIYGNPHIDLIRFTGDSNFHVTLRGQRGQGRVKVQLLTSRPELFKNLNPKAGAIGLFGPF